MGYIKGPREEGCFFCRKSKEDKDAANYILWRHRTCFVLMNTYPYNPGHLMVAPYKHTGEMEELAEGELAELMQVTRQCKAVLAGAINPQGFNIGFNIGAAGGAGVVDHIHLHIVPRWAGDTNFMPVLGDTRVVPQSLDEMYQRLAAACEGTK
jgi:ATP adenylyltransferase